MNRPTKPVNLTEIIIKALKPEAQPYEVSDTIVKGFRLRVSTAGTKSFTFLYFLAGERKREPLGRFGEGGISLAEARAKALGMLATVKGERKAPEPVIEKPRPEGLTANALINEYIASERFTSLRPRTQDHISYLIEKHLTPEFGERTLGSITSTEVYEWGVREVKRAKVVANHQFVTMRAIWNWGLSNPSLGVSPSPFFGLKKPYGGGAKKKKKALSIAELQKVFAGLLEEPRDIVGWWLLMLLHGTRKGETNLAEKTERQKTQRGWLWNIPPEKTKTNVRLFMPLTDVGKKVFDLATARSESSRWLFGSPQGPEEPRCLVTGSPIVRMKTRTGVDFSPHSLRHTVASTMGELGIEPHVIDVVLNHRLPTDSKVTGTYNDARLWAYFDQKRQALERWHAFLDTEVLGGKLDQYLWKAFTLKRNYEERMEAVNKGKRLKRKAA